MTSPHLLILIELKSVYTTLWVKTYCPSNNALSTDKKLWDCRYSIAISMACFLMPYVAESHQPCPETGHATYTRMNHPYSVCIPLEISKFHWENLFPRTAAFWNRLQEWFFPTTIILTLKRSRFKRFPFLHNPMSYTFALSYAHTTLYSSNLSWVVLRSCIAWTLLLKNSYYDFRICIMLIKCPLKFRQKWEVHKTVLFNVYPFHIPQNRNMMK